MVLEITQARENCGITNSLILGRDLSTSTSKFATAVSLDPLIYCFNGHAYKTLFMFVGIAAYTDKIDHIVSLEINFCRGRHTLIKLITSCLLK
jgi:hypothetical protein